MEDEGTLTVRVFDPTKETREVETGEVFLGRKDLIFQPGTMIFSSTSLIQFYQSLICSHLRVIVCWRGA